MAYWSVSLLAAVIHAVINQDVLFDHGTKDKDPAHAAYRAFARAVLGYLASDVLWGVFDRLGLTLLTNIDTYVYFLCMAVTILMWARYVVAYLNDDGIFEKALLRTSQVLFFLQIATIIINVFLPVTFWFDKDGAYHAGPVRYLNLAAQTVVFAACSVFALIQATRHHHAYRGRWRTIGLSSLTMTIATVLQVRFPLLPLYAIGCTLEGCMVHSFVLESEREQYRTELELALERERRTIAELEAARRQVMVDSLTGAGSKTAFLRAQDTMDEKIRQGTAVPFAVAVGDLNGLKHANDTLGHAAGDQLLVDGCALIMQSFTRSEVFRIGGDEFCIYVVGEDYERLDEIMRDFNTTVESNLAHGRVVVSLGVARLEPELDQTTDAVFKRADVSMYQRKRELELMGAFGR